MGIVIKDKAFKRDHKTTYTIIGYKYIEDDEVFLTTVDPQNPHSKRLTRPELNEMKEWLKGDDGVFDNTTEGIYMHRAASMDGYVHVRDKTMGEYVYTYVPAQFLSKL